MPPIPSTIRQLRNQAIAHSLFAPVSLPAAMQRLGFVQADPIRAPARAQDLILRHRVDGYRVGDLERHYADLDVEEAFLHVYGFLPRPLARLLHPRKAARPAAIDRKVLEIVERDGPIHPRELEAHFGRRRVINGWGGYSQATKRALERLHYQGQLRIAHRVNGIRVYQAGSVADDALPPSERLAQLIRLLAGLLAPVQERSLSAAAARVARDMPRTANHRSVLQRLVKSGELKRHVIDGVAYLRPAAGLPDEDTPQRVRILAPFDPLVWDRNRFEHLWQWSYRFEAYTPLAKRQRGYYALPLLWRDAVIGWANASVSGGRLSVDVGYADRQPRDAAFRHELDREIAGLEVFLDLENASTEDDADPSVEPQEMDR